MKNRWLLNIGLAVLVGVLIWLGLYQPGAKHPTVGSPLTDIKAHTIQQMRLLRPKQPPLVLEKAAGGWRLTAPLTARANDVRVNELLQILSTPVTNRFSVEADKLSQYGLDNPLATLFFNAAEIRFGATHPLDNQLYVGYNQQVQLVSVAAFRIATASVNDFLSTSLLEDQTQALALQFPAFSLKQNAEGEWVRTPESKALSSDALTRFVDEWRYARALSVAPYSGKPIQQVIRLTLVRDGKQGILELGVLATKPELILYRQDEKLEYHFPADIGARLLQIQAE